MTTETATKERPILFSGPMVRAILDARKTQTRRIVKPQPPSVVKTIVPGCFYDGTGGFGFENEDGDKWKCPYGAPGGTSSCDRLWVREAWRPTWASAGGILNGPGIQYREGLERIGHPQAAKYGDSYSEEDGWRPSIHMPRWASRLTLDVTGVRVERLQDITEEDAIAEGSQCAGVPASLTNRGAFAKLWESINGPGSWDANPWVWVVEISADIDTTP